MFTYWATFGIILAILFLHLLTLVGNECSVAANLFQNFACQAFLFSNNVFY